MSKLICYSDRTNIQKTISIHQIKNKVFLNYFQFPSVYGASQGLQIQ